MGRTNKNSLALNNEQINPGDHRKVETQIDVSNIHNIGNGDQSENIESTIINVEKLNINENEKETSDDNESESNQIVRTSCSLYPMGWLTLLPIILSTLAWIFSLTRDGCSHARITGPIVHQLTNDSTVPFLHLGYNGYRLPVLNNQTQDGLNGDLEVWHIDYSSKCRDYDRSYVERDLIWNFSEAFAFLSLVFGGGGALLLWLTTCFVFSSATWRWTGYEILLACVFQSLAFLWFETKVCRNGSDCTLTFGSISDIISAVCWFSSACYIFVMFPCLKRKESNSVKIRREITSSLVNRNNKDGKQIYSSSSTVSNNSDSFHGNKDKNNGGQKLKLPIVGNSRYRTAALECDRSSLEMTRNGYVV